MDNVQLSIEASAWSRRATSLLNLPHAVAACPFSLARALTGGPPHTLLTKQNKTNKEDESVCVTACMIQGRFCFVLYLSQTAASSLT